MTTTPKAKRLILRQASGIWIPVVVWAVAALLGVDTLRTASGLALWRDLAGLAFVCWLAHAVLWAPRLLVGREEAVAHEITRTTTLPHEAVTDIHVGGQVTIDYRDAAGHQKRLRSWNAPGLPRRQQMRPPKRSAGRFTEDGNFLSREQARDRRPDLVDHSRSPMGPSAALVSAWAAHAHDGEPRAASTSWNVAELAIGAALLAALLLLQFAA